MIKFEKVTKQFPDGTVALDGIDLEINDGEFLFVTGPSGAGKTTILRLVTRELIPTAGTILAEGMDLAKLSNPQVPKLRRKIGTIFQDYKLLTDRTVAENVAIALEVLGLAEKEIGKQVVKILEMVGLAGKENFFPGQLSGGELQRTVIARAVAASPKVILADEPTADLDPATGWEIIVLLDQINKLGTTVVMATHNADIVNSLSRRVVHLDRGKILKDEAKGKYGTV